MTEESQKKSSESRPQTGAARKAAASRPQTGAARKAAASRPQTGTAKKTAGSKPQAGGAHKAASSRPQSATAQGKKRTSTGRPLEQNNRAGQKSRQSAAAGGRQSGTVRGSVPVRKKKKQIRVTLTSKQTLAAAFVCGLILAVIAAMITRASLLRVKQTETDYNLGDAFDINNFFEPYSDDAVVEYDRTEFSPDGLGEYKIKFTVRRGKLSRTQKGIINVVDETKPYIDGPDEIDVAVGEEIDWSAYYTVTDDDPDIEDKIESSIEIDTSQERTVKTTLSVTDWAGNTSEKNVTVNIVETNFTE